jgi:hypothetical protein
VKRQALGCKSEEPSAETIGVMHELAHGIRPDGRIPTRLRLLELRLYAESTKVAQTAEGAPQKLVHAANELNSVQGSPGCLLAAAAAAAVAGAPAGLLVVVRRHDLGRPASLHPTRNGRCDCYNRGVCGRPVGHNRHAREEQQRAA